MKRLTVPITVKLIVEDDVDATKAADLLSQAMLRTNIAPVEAVSIGRHQLEDVRTGFCKPGDHTFVVDHLFSPDKEVPPVCRDHWYSGAIESAHEEHKPLFDEVERLTGLKGEIWQSGGMTMTMVFELPGAQGDYSPKLPCYLGLKEGEDGFGDWIGSVSYYRNEEAMENGDGVDVVMAYDGALNLHQWAAKMKEHLDGLLPAMPPQDTSAELDFDTVEFLGLDGTGMDGDERFPFTWDNLSDIERQRLLDVTAYRRRP